MVNIEKKTFIIAEIGMSHDGSLGQAKAFIDAAAEIGVDAVKFQTHIAEAETLKDAPTPPYFTDEPRYEYFKRTAFNLEQHIILKNHAESKGLEFISSPFSIEAVELLENVGVSTYKIPSGEVTNLPLLERVAKTGKQILLSSGMSSYSELDEAVDGIQRYNKNLVILQCTSKYPCPLEDVGLNLLEEFKKRYKLPVGLSDHTLGIYAPLAAVVLGATVIEKHFTISKKLYGPDAKYSLEPHEFKQLVDGIRALEVMLASPVDKDNINKFKEMKNTFQKSIVSLVAMPKGIEITREMITTKKPGGGLHPRYFEVIIGKKVKREIKKDSLIFEEDIKW
jgi:sialic acid synthase SpsE